MVGKGGQGTALPTPERRQGSRTTAVLAGRGSLGRERAGGSARTERVGRGVPPGPGGGANSPGHSSPCSRAGKIQQAHTQEPLQSAPHCTQCPVVREGPDPSEPEVGMRLGWSQARDGRHEFAPETQSEWPAPHSMERCISRHRSRSPNKKVTYPAQPCARHTAGHFTAVISLNLSNLGSGRARLQEVNHLPKVTMTKC